VKKIINIDELLILDGPALRRTKGISEWKIVVLFVLGFGWWPPS
jgi:hypothetical protein